MKKARFLSLVAALCLAVTLIAAPAFASTSAVEQGMVAGSQGPVTEYQMATGDDEGLLDAVVGHITDIPEWIQDIITGGGNGL